MTQAEVDALREHVHRVARRLGLEGAPRAAAADRRRTAKECIEELNQDAVEYEDLLEDGTRRKRAVRPE